MNLESIQCELQKAGLDGWLFLDHHGKDPLACQVLGINTSAHATRRWYYFIPSRGEPRGLVHRIEPAILNPLPGKKILYARWQEHETGLRDLLGGARKVAMQYSPNCAVPYVANVDAGTVERVRSLGTEVVSSAELIQLFEARWTPAMLELHLEAARDAGVRLVKEAVASGRTLHGFEIDDVVRGYIEARGLGSCIRHRTGHSIGREVHGVGTNIDNFETHDERSIIPWTCFSIEPSIYLPEFGVRTEIDVFVDEHSARVTGELQTAIVLL